MAVYVVRDVPGASVAVPVRPPDASWPAAEQPLAAHPSAVARTCPCCDGSDAPVKGIRRIMISIWMEIVTKTELKPKGLGC